LKVIIFKCDHCRKVIKASPDERDTKVECPHCNMSTLVPDIEPNEEADIEDLNEEIVYNKLSAFKGIKYIAFILPIISILNTILRLPDYYVIDFKSIVSMIYINLSSVFMAGIFFLAAYIVENIVAIKGHTSVLSKIELIKE